MSKIIKTNILFIMLCTFVYLSVSYNAMGETAKHCQGELGGVACDTSRNVWKEYKCGSDMCRGTEYEPGEMCARCIPIFGPFPEGK